MHMQNGWRVTSCCSGFALPRAHQFRGTWHLWAPWLSPSPLEGLGTLRTRTRYWHTQWGQDSAAWPKGRQWKKTQLLSKSFCSGPRVWPLALGLSPISWSTSFCSVLCTGWPAPTCKTATRTPQQSPSECVSLSSSNLCPKSLFGLKVTLQPSTCTNAMKERRGSVSQFIFQIGDKNWLVMAENSTKDYYCWLIPLWQKVR